MSSYVRNAETSFLVLCIGSLVLLVGAWFTQLVWDWFPCPMCLWQREPHYLVLLVGLVAAVGSLIGGLRPYLFLGAFAIAAVAYGFVIYRAGFHVGVEQLWWQGWAVCGSGGAGSGVNANDLLAAPTVDCTVPTYVLPGISMALAHFGAASGLLLFSLWWFMRPR